jgi:YtkA-like
MRLLVPVILGLVFSVGCADDGHDDDVVDCAKETRDDNFVIGLEKAGERGKLDFKLINMTPAPPTPGDNTWVVQINSMAGGSVGAPLPGATMSVTPFMPDHGHAAGKSVVVEPQTEAGQYKLSPVNTWMPGLWETTINVDGVDGDKVVLKVCIPS